MPNWYVNRDALRSALGFPSSAASATDQNALLDAANEGVARLIDQYLGFPAFPSSATRYYEARETDCLYLDVPLLAVDSIQLDQNEDTTYESTMTSTGYFLKPDNATAESPRHPFWEIQVRSNSTLSLPVGVQRGVKITGTWGYFNETKSTTAVVGATAIASGDLSFGITGATSLHTGQTILIDSERMFVTATPATVSGGSHTSQVTVERAKNGSAAAAHTSGAAISFYEYPIIQEAAKFQAQMDYRAKDAPLGIAGGQPFGETRANAPGGLHPFVERMLAPLRTWVAG